MSTRPLSCLGRYELIREVARSNDVVYEGWDPHTQRRVAVKALNIPDGASHSQKQDRTMRFEREARAAARLQHPNIVTLFDFGTDDGQPYLVFEFVEGPTLADLIEARGKLDPHTASTYTQQLLSALGYAHSQGVVHRDIKPGNIFICPGDHLKVTDLGIARIENEDAVTCDGQIFGTPSYMAPEQVKGEPVDRRVDLWSAGVVLFQLLTGEKPFAGGSVLEIGSNIVSEEPDLSLVSDYRLKGVVAKALRKDPAERYATASQMSTALEMPAIPQVSNPTLQLAGPPVFVASTKKRLAVWAAYGLALMLGAGVAGLQAWRSAPAAEIPTKPAVAKTAAKPLAEVLDEAWEHNSLHELASSSEFKFLYQGAQLDKLDTWCRTKIGADYLALDDTSRSMLLTDLLSKFKSLDGERFGGFANSRSVTSPPFYTASTFPAPTPAATAMPMTPRLPTKAELEQLAKAGAPTPAQQAAAGRIHIGPQPNPRFDHHPVEEKRIPTDPAPAVESAPFTDNQAEPPADQGEYPLQRAVFFDDQAVLRRLHFHATNVTVLPGGTREYSGPDGVVRVR